MKKKNLFIFLFCFVLGLSACFSISTNFIASATSDENLIIRSYGDSIAAGYALSTPESDAYPIVFANPYLEHFEGQVIQKGVSGDTSSDLLEDLEPYKNGTAEDMESFNDTDIVTLCIGANNVLGVALDNISSYLNDSLSDDEYRILLSTGVTQFQQDYPEILETFSGKYVVAMTIYNPYEYTELTDVNTSNLGIFYKNTVKSYLAEYNTKLQNMLSITMEYLEQINDIIRQSASSDVCVVDIYSLFKTFNEDDYIKYINANVSAVTLQNSDIKISASGIDVSAIFSKITAASDPHPTKEGHIRIAQEHLNTFKYFELYKTGNFEDLQKPTDTISLNLKTIEIENYDYNVYRKENGVKTLIKSSSTLPISIEASSISGEGTIFVEVIKNNNLIFTTNELEFAVSLNYFELVSTSDLLEKIYEVNEFVEINVVSENLNGYKFILYKKVDNITTKLAENELGEFSIPVTDMTGKGEVYVEVYETETLVFTTNSLSFDIIVGTFKITTTSNLVTTTNPGNVIIINVNSPTIPNPQYKLFNEVDGSKTQIDSNNLGIFEIKAKDIEGKGKLYVEIYSNNEKVSTTNSLEYNISFTTPASGKGTSESGSIIFYISIALVGSMILGLVVYYFIRIKKKTKLY